MSANTIGILTGGGDVPGLNSVIKSVVYRATEMGKNVIGIRKGWKGLTNVDPAETGESIYRRELTRENTLSIDRRGGTVLHTSRTNPSRVRSTVKAMTSPQSSSRICSAWELAAW
jgi:6-phosphofructokinase